MGIDKDYKESKNFKAFRKHKSLTQKELGEIIGKTQAMVQRYESGEYLIPGRVVATMVDKLKMSHEWFYHGTGEMENNKAIVTQKSSSNESRALLLEIRVENLEKQVRALELLVKQLTDVDH